MRCFKQTILAAKIEYHWWRITYKRKSRNLKESEIMLCSENLHRYRAEQLSVIYEISLGIRDYKGNIIA